jgi:hypothetical protein
MSEKSVARKLQMRPNSTVLFVNAPKDHESKIGPFPEGTFVVKKIAGRVDFVQVYVESRNELEEWLPRLKSLVGPAGILWVTYHKGSSGVKTDINRDSIAAYANTVGMKAVTQVAIDENWSALRLKIV